jgi:hypothetical protein
MQQPTDDPLPQVASVVVHRLRPGELVELVSPAGERTQLRVSRDGKGRLSLAVLAPLGGEAFQLLFPPEPDKV